MLKLFLFFLLDYSIERIETKWKAAYRKQSMDVKFKNEADDE